MPIPGQNQEEVKKIEEMNENIYEMAKLITKAMEHIATLPDHELADIVISFKEPMSSMAWETLIHRKNVPQDVMERIIHSSNDGVLTRKSQWEKDWNFETISIPEKHRRALAE